jgi:FtsH-binding integral membrane protein
VNCSNSEAEEDRRVLIQVYSNTHLQLTTLFGALAIGLFAEVELINKIPTFVPHPNFFIYAAIAATLTGELMILDVMWFWGNVQWVVSRTPLKEIRMKESGDSFVSLDEYYGCEGLKRSWWLTKYRQGHRWAERGAIPVLAAFGLTLVVLYALAAVGLFQGL